MHNMYQCDCCQNYDAEGDDGRSPHCKEGYAYKHCYEKKCSGFELGVPDSYPSDQERLKRKAMIAAATMVSYLK